MYRKNLSVLSFIFAIFLVLTGFSSLEAQASFKEDQTTFKEDQTTYKEDATAYKEDQTKLSPDGSIDSGSQSTQARSNERSTSSGRSSSGSRSSGSSSSRASSGGASSGASASMQEWRSNTMQAALGLGYGTGFGSFFEFDINPQKKRDWFWLKFGLGYFGATGSANYGYREPYFDGMSTGTRENRGTDDDFAPDGFSHFSLYIAPKAKFKIKNVDLSVYLGVGVGIPDSEPSYEYYYEYDYSGIYYEGRMQKYEYFDIGIGPVFGVEADFKVGPGCIFAALKGGVFVNMGGTGNIPNENNSSGYGGPVFPSGFYSLSSFASFQVCAGYKFSFGKKEIK